MHARRMSLVAGTVLALALASGCGSSSKSNASGSTTTSGGTVVHVNLVDTKGLNGPMKLIADKSTVPAGKVTFIIKNTGTIEHELVVLKMTGNEAWNTMPVTYAGDPPAPVNSGGDKVSEANDELDTGSNLAPGTTRTMSGTLAAGSYALVCNIAKHYGLGMRAGLTVS